MKLRYFKKDAVDSYRWLGHESKTELVAIHRDYKPGIEHVEENKQNRAFPRVAYASDADNVIDFIKRYGAERMVCYGLNERPKIFRNERGYVRAAREKEIEVSQNILVDIDLETKAVSKGHYQELENVRKRVAEYCADKEMIAPVYAMTGQGMHLLFAHARIQTKDVPDISLRNKAFVDEMRDEFKGELSRIEARIDATHDLARKVKIYGTAKPWVGRVSRFYGGERKEDAGLRDYLLSITLPDIGSRSLGGLELALGSELPLWFRSLLEHDEVVRKLWHGEGKDKESDTTGSGYDFSLARTLLKRGYRNLDELGTIVALRGQKKRDERYIRRTLGNALLK